MILLNLFLLISNLNQYFNLFISHFLINLNLMMNPTYWFIFFYKHLQLSSLLLVNAQFKVLKYYYFYQKIVIILFLIIILKIIFLKYHYCFIQLF